MTRSIHKLTARQVHTTKRPGRYSDGAGLYLRVAGNGKKRWVFRYTPARGAKPREMGLGSAEPSGVSLAEAREKARAQRTCVQAGEDPIHTTHKAKANAAGGVPLFGDFVDEFLETHLLNFKNAKHIAQWRMTLSVYAAPLHAKRVNEISTEDVLAILKPIWRTKNETASRLRGRIETVLSAAKVKGYRSGENPALWRDHLSLLLPKRSKLDKGHFAALPYLNMPAFMQRLRKCSGMAALALEFDILAAARPGETRFVEKHDLDLEQAIWTVPAEKMKEGRSHRVPLTSRMLEIIEIASQWNEGSDYVFPNSKGMPLSDAAMNAVLKRMNVHNSTVHGFRSTFRDWVGDETNHPREVAEAQLSHAVGDESERAYRRSDALLKRRTLMDDWERYLFSEPNAGIPDNALGQSTLGASRCSSIKRSNRDGYVIETSSEGVGSVLTSTHRPLGSCRSIP